MSAQPFSSPDRTAFEISRSFTPPLGPHAALDETGHDVATALSDSERFPGNDNLADLALAARAAELAAVLEYGAGDVTIDPPSPIAPLTSPTSAPGAAAQSYARQSSPGETSGSLDVKL